MKNIDSKKPIPVNFYPQDPLATTMEETTLPAEFAEKGNLAGPRDIIRDRSKIAQPDAKGEMKYLPTDDRFDQVAVLLAADRTLSMWEKYAGRTINYAFKSKQLTCKPHAGEDFNAYYARSEESANFFYKKDPVLGKMILSAQSREVVDHEKGHATLDGLKPALLSSWSTDAGGLHESFGDISAILETLGNAQVVNKMLAETEGNIRKSNVVTKMAEELSRGIADVVRKLPPGEAEKFIIRDAANKLVWQNPSTLPFNPKDPEQLGSEVHNYSRLFTGTVWDIFCSIYERGKTEGKDPKEAAAQAVNGTGTLVAKMLDFAPDSINAYKQLGKAMLIADAKSMGGRNKGIIADAMVKRKILTPGDVKQIEEELTTLPSITFPAGFKPEDLLTQYADQLGLDKNDLPMLTEVVKNDSGETFYRYMLTKETKLDGAQFKRYNGAYIDVQGSLVLGLDSKGKLMHVENAPVTVERQDAARSYVLTLINEGLVKYFQPMETSSTRDLFKSDGQPYAAYTKYADNGTKMKLEPVPIFT